MRKIIKILTVIIPIIITSLTMGCTVVKSDVLKSKSETQSYFHKGVYKSYSPDKKQSHESYFYVFYDEFSGHTEDSKLGIGLPFSCIQTNNSVKFRFGGAEEPEEIFKITSVKDNSIEGSFEDNQLLIFTFISNANPDNFDAIQYIKKNN